MTKHNPKANTNGSLAVEIEFIVTEGESKQLLELIEREKIRVFYACIPARFGIINPDHKDPPESPL